MATEKVALRKLKVAQLKQECLARRSETKGIKQDLIHRLQAYLEEHGGVSGIAHMRQSSLFKTTWVGLDPPRNRC
uniref:SAP domain-containing ribonucleoprotein n=1 Tax=Callithrix jacchus TaxID=9483 RepID=A0A8I3W850_CALJA